VLSICEHTYLGLAIHVVDKIMCLLNLTELISDIIQYKRLAGI